MLRRSTKSRARKHNRYYERLGLEQQGDPHVQPYRYIRPSTEILGTLSPIPTEYDITRSTINIHTTSVPSTDSDSNNETSDSSISQYDIRIYNRLEGRWEAHRPLPFPHLPEYQLWKQQEKERSTTEPHPTHSDWHRSFYCEYHRLRVYNNSTDSSFNTSNLSSTSTESTGEDYDYTDNIAFLNSEYNSQLWEGNNQNYWPEIYETQETIELEFDSDGDFPLTYNSSSTDSSSNHSQSQSNGYATQDEVHDPNHPLSFDNTVDPVTGQYNLYYQQHLIDCTGLPGRREQRITGPRVRIPTTGTTPSPSINYLIEQVAIGRDDSENTSIASTPPVEPTQNTAPTSAKRVTTGPNTPVHSTEHEEDLYADPPYLDDRFDYHTGRYNDEYWAYINNNHPIQRKSTARTSPVPPTNTTNSTSTTGITATETIEYNPLPVLGNRRYLPILAARKSIQRVTYRTPSSTGSFKYAHLRSTKQVARKSTITKRERTVTQKVPTPDTTCSHDHLTTTGKRTRESSSSSDTSSSEPITNRYKDDWNDDWNV
jgi:hypothetical protein